MRNSLFHAGDIKTSARLKFALEILKDAGWPMTVLEIQAEAIRRGGGIPNAGTTIGEIAQNPGYRTSDGQMYGQKKGPAVKFPDGRYRYWLTAAPGWKPKWIVTKDFKIVLFNAAAIDKAVKRTTNIDGQVCSGPEDNRGDEYDQKDIVAPKTSCMACGKQTLSPLPWCDDECKKNWKIKQGWKT